jgi:hypothetical protein
MIQARMRVGASWSDACILNLSSRGMMVGAPTAPSRGSYLEIRRGSHVIVACVVWSNSNRFGVRTQDVIPADELINQPDRAIPAKRGNEGLVDRRAAPRSAGQRHEASRWRARGLEFGVFALMGAVAATVALGAVGELLQRPLAAIETAFGAS